jgi:hypothetical protein
VTIEKVLRDFQQESNISDLTVDFPEELTSNFLKILSNTFYLNLKKVTLKLKTEILDKGIKLSQEEMSDAVANYYQESLIETRKTTLSFFQVKKGYLKSSSLMRCYVFTLLRSNPVRQRYELLNDILHKVEENLGKKIIPTEFIDQSSEYYTNDIKDVNKYF